MRKLHVIAVLLIVLVAINTKSYAKTGEEIITATYSNIQIEFNGNKLNLANEKGDAVNIFVSKGTTYIPVRVLGNALGLDVSWDAERNAVVLKGGSDIKSLEAKDHEITERLEDIKVIYRDVKVELNGYELELLDENKNKVEPFIFSGTTYLPIRAISEALDIKVDYDSANKVIKLINEKENVVVKELDETKIPLGNEDVGISFSDKKEWEYMEEVNYSQMISELTNTSGNHISEVTFYVELLNDDNEVIDRNVVNFSDFASEQTVRFMVFFEGEMYDANIRYVVK